MALAEEDLLRVLRLLHGYDAVIDLLLRERTRLPVVTLKALERQAVVEALDRHHGQQKRAAADLGISGRMLGYRMGVLGIRSARAEVFARKNVLNMQLRESA